MAVRTVKELLRRTVLLVCTKKLLQPNTEVFCHDAEGGDREPGRYGNDVTIVDCHAPVAKC
jgi:hypothetical protein